MTNLRDLIASQEPVGEHLQRAIDETRAKIDACFAGRGKFKARLKLGRAIRMNDFGPLRYCRIGVGRLGAGIASNQPIETLNAIQLDMIERRILRIEAALKLAGIDVEALPLPD